MMNMERTADRLGDERISVVQETAQCFRDPRSPAHAWINTIQMYRFPLGLAVVAVHSGEFVSTWPGTESPCGVNGNLGLWIVQFLTLISRVATPAFLVIAGFVFFRDGRISFEEYRRKLKSRFYTLLVPYFAWNFITVLMLCAPAAFKYLFFAAGSHTYTLLTFNKLASWIVGWPVYPADAPLWFVRDLLLLITISPLWNMLPKRVQVAGLGSLFAYWVLGPIDLVPGGIPRAASVFFFLSGAWMGMNQNSLPVGSVVDKVMVISGVAFVLSAAVGATCGTMGGDNLTAQPVLDKMVRVSGALLVVCAGTRTSFPKWLSGPLLRLSPAAFFLFAFHYCVFVSITGLSAKFAPDRLGAGHELLLFGVVFSTVIAVSLGCYFFLRNYAPLLLSMLDGNRSARGSGVHSTGHEVQVSPLPINARPAPSFE